MKAAPLLHGQQTPQRLSKFCLPTFEQVLKKPRASHFMYPLGAVHAPYTVCDHPFGETAKQSFSKEASGLLPCSHQRFGQELALDRAVVHLVFLYLCYLYNKKSPICSHPKAVGSTSNVGCTVPSIIACADGYFFGSASNTLAEHTTGELRLSPK